MTRLYVAIGGLLLVILAFVWQAVALRSANSEIVRLSRALEATQQAADGAGQVIAQLKIANADWEAQAAQAQAAGRLAGEAAALERDRLANELSAARAARQVIYRESKDARDWSSTLLPADVVRGLRASEADHPD